MAPNVLSLKQRLAALSTSMPGARSDTPPQSPVWKRRAFFSPPSKTRTSDSFQDDTAQRRDNVKDVMSRVIFQAGVDYESVSVLYLRLLLLIWCPKF